MVGGDHSKALGSVAPQDEIKQMIVEALKGDQTRGFDIDSMYWHEGKPPVILEFLKCDSVPPHKSHPKYYWNPEPPKKNNWRKFSTLWKVAQALNAKFYLVNWSPKNGDVTIFEVLDCVPGPAGKMTLRRYDTDRDGYSKWYRGLNETGIPPPLPDGSPVV